jgi:hypothetical protein
MIPDCKLSQLKKLDISNKIFIEVITILAVFTVICINYKYYFILSFNIKYKNYFYM